MTKLHHFKTYLFELIFYPCQTTVIFLIFLKTSHPYAPDSLGGCFLSSPTKLYLPMGLRFQYFPSTNSPPSASVPDKQFACFAISL